MGDMLTGILIGGLVTIFVVCLLDWLVTRRRPEVSLEPAAYPITKIAPCPAVKDHAGRDLKCQRVAPHPGEMHRHWMGEKGWIVWALLLVMVSVPALADDHNEPPTEPFDGPVTECADLMGRYVKCPEAPKPAPTPAPAPTPEPVTVVIERPVVPEFCATCAENDAQHRALEKAIEDSKPDLQKPATMLVGAGGIASLGGGAEGVAIEPGVSLLFDGPLYANKKGLATRLEVDARLGVDQGPAVELDQNTAFRSVAVAGRLCQPLSAKLYFLPCVEAGFATRLEGDLHPRYRSPRWLSFQIKAVNSRGDFLSIGVGPDERLDDGGDPGRTGGPYYRAASQVSASVKLWGPTTTDKVHLRLVMQAVLFLRVGAVGRQGAPADRVTLGILVAR